MSVVTVTKVIVLKNPALFTDPFEFEVHYEAIENLEQDLEWKIIYVGSPDNCDHDQEIESVLVGPVAAGRYKFILQGDAPDPNKIPEDDLMGMTAILLTCSYVNQEFIRVGYYVNVDYIDEEMRENPPEKPILEKLGRSIIDSDPRVTHCAVDFKMRTECGDDVNMDVENQERGDKSLFMFDVSNE